MNPLRWIHRNSVHSKGRPEKESFSLGKTHIHLNSRVPAYIDILIIDCTVSINEGLQSSDSIADDKVTSGFSAKSFESSAGRTKFKGKLFSFER